MGRRTLAGHKLTFHKYREKGETASPADLNGVNLADVFQDWAESLKGSIVEVSNQSFLRIDRVVRYNPAIVLVETMAGKAGEAGEVVDSESSEVRFSLTERDVPASRARAVLICPPRGQAALWFSEYSARSSGASMLLSRFSSSWKAGERGFTMCKERLIAYDVVAENGTVTEVEVRLSKRADDRADGQDALVGTLIHKFKPARKHRFLGTIIDKFRDNPNSAYEMVGIQGADYKDSEIFVSVDVDGRKRRIQIFNPEDGVYFREELNDSAHPILTDDQLVEYCCENAETYLKRFGFDWEKDWSSRGGWRGGW